MSKLGFIGLGIMGEPMAAHLIKAGHEVFLSTRSQIPADLLTGKAVACASAQEVAEKADIIFMMLPDTPDVAKVLFGEKGVSAGLKSKGKGKPSLRICAGLALYSYTSNTADKKPSKLWS